uniref:Dolichyl-phosphate-mannose--protein mannosyltransferase n=1 Tax=Romanomermis culicivorax TaxID=13658 RepID=A0A915K9F9_ROMCU
MVEKCFGQGPVLQRFTLASDTLQDILFAKDGKVDIEFKETIYRFAQIGVVLLIVPFLPASNLLIRVGFVVAERVLYIPSMGYCILVSTAFTWIDFALLLLLMTFSCKCLQRNQDWHNEKILFLSGALVCPNNAKIHYNIGKVSDVEVAEEAYRLAITLNPSYDHAMNNLANLLKEKGDLVEAASLLTQALNLRPKFSIAWMNLGIVKASEKKYVESEYCYFKALSFRTYYADCYFNLGNLYHEMGRSYQAFNCWMNATKANPKHVKSWINLMLISDEMNETVQALYYGNTATRHLGENAAIYSIMAGFLGKLNRFQESENLFLRAIRLETDNTLLYGNLGILYHRWKRYEKALWAYKEALKKNPKLETIRRHMDEILSSGKT